MTVLAGVADFEHKLLRERTAVRRVVSKQHRVPFGRHKKMIDEQKFKALCLWQEGMPVIEIAKIFNVHRTTIYRLDIIVQTTGLTREEIKTLIENEAHTSLEHQSQSDVKKH